MTLTAIVGALVALIPAFRPKGDKAKEAPVDDKTNPRFIAGYDAGLNDGRLEAEDLNRDLAIQRALVDHWKGQARILAQALRREREQRGLPQPAAQAQHEIAYAQAAQHLENQLAQYNQHAAMQAQHYASMVPSQLGQGQLGQQYAAQQLGAQPQCRFRTEQEAQAFGFCNCVPSRAQVWGARHGLVQEVNGLVNRLNQILG